MKKIATSIALAVTIIAAHAQNAEVKIKVKEAEIPVSVVKSFKKDFAGVEAQEWAIVPATVIGEEYVVSGYDNLDGAKPTSYSVRTKGSNMKSEAVYNAAGKLMYSKEVIKDTALPKVVTETVLKKYPGYALIKDQETIREGKTNFIHYRVIVEKGKDKKALAVDASGKILREKKIKV